jgi:hypothetical protein
MMSNTYYGTFSGSQYPDSVAGAAESLPSITVETASLVGKNERARGRIKLFRSLFRWREDFYTCRALKYSPKVASSRS